MSSRSTKSSVPASSRGKAAAAAGASNKTRAVRSPGPVGRAPAIKSNNATRKRLRKQSTGEDSDADVSAVADDGAAAAASLTVGDDSVGLDQLQLATPKSSPSKKARSRAGETKVIPTSSRVLFGNSKGPGRSSVIEAVAADSDDEPSAAASSSNHVADDAEQPQEPSDQDDDDAAVSEVNREDGSSAAGEAEDTHMATGAAESTSDSDSSDSSASDSDEADSDSDASSSAEPAPAARGRRGPKVTRACMSKSAPHTPPKQKKAAAAAAAASSPASPVKKWVPPITTTAFASASGKVSASAKQFNVSPMVIGDVGSAMNNASRVLRKTIILRNLQWDGKDEADDNMILTAFGDDVPKYLNNLELGKCYTLDLEKQLAPVGKPLCIDGHNHYYKLAANSKIREYETIDKVEATRQSIQMELLFGSAPISGVRVAAAGAQCNVLGVVMKVSPHPMKNGAGLKIILADQICYVNVMFFEPKANITIGTSLKIVGAKLWINNKTGAKELSCWNTTVVETNLHVLPKELLKRARNSNYDGLDNVSQVPSEEPRLMSDLIEEAAQLESETEQIHATVLLHLDASRPTNGGNITYNSCVRPECKRKIHPINAKDEHGNDLYDHEVDRGESHKSTTYACRYFFNGRFKEDDAAPVYLGQVDDALGEALFGCTADQLSELDADARTALLQKVATHSFKFNVAISKAGAIASMILV